MILPPSFWTEEELIDIPSEDLWCELADAMFFSNTKDYVEKLSNELKKREVNQL